MLEIVGISRFDYLCRNLVFCGGIGRRHFERLSSQFYQRLVRGCCIVGTFERVSLSIGRVYLELV